MRNTKVKIMEQLKKIFELLKLTSTKYTNTEKTPNRKQLKVYLNDIKFIEKKELKLSKNRNIKKTLKKLLL